MTTDVTVAAFGSAPFEVVVQLQEKMTLTDEQRAARPDLRFTDDGYAIVNETVFTGVVWNGAWSNYLTDSRRVVITERRKP